MKIQELSIIFVIIIIPISLVLSIFTQSQMQTISIQTLYDTKLTSATYDAMKAFQLNSANSDTSDLADSKLRDLEASITTFRNSLKSSFELNGYTEEELNNYIPALVYTLYDGIYIYSPYENVNHRYEPELDEDGKETKNPYTELPIHKEDSSGNKTEIDNNGEKLYGLKPYITYSCRYKIDELNDFVITYSLDNYIVLQGMIKGTYIKDEGYLIDGITVEVDTSGSEQIKYNGVVIQQECLSEYLPIGKKEYKYVKLNGVKYYLDESNKLIFYILNGNVKIQCYDNPDISDSEDPYNRYKDLIEQNTLAKEYYKQAKEFTERVLGNDTGQYDLSELKYKHAVDEVIDNDGVINIDNVWKDDESYIFKSDVNIENELSNFNQHRISVIRHKIETNLSIAISNYNDYSGATNEFQMPELKEDEWNYLINNISVISFLQGLPIGGKTYNGYTIVTNSESKEVVLEENIYILGDNTYYRVGDTNLEGDEIVNINGARLNLDFKRQYVLSDDGTIHLYYYPIGSYDSSTDTYSSANASYNSIVAQNEVTTYQDIYEYINRQNNNTLKQVFYTALGRERAGKYKSNISIDILKISEAPLVPEEPEITTYTVTYHTNGGTGTVTSQIRNIGDNVTLMDGNTLRAPSGTHFRGWCAESSGSGTIYDSSSTQLFSSNITLYAIWYEHTDSCYEEHVHIDECYSHYCINCGEVDWNHDGLLCDNFEAELECSKTRELICGGTE